MVPMVDLKKQFGSIKREVLKTVTDILESSHYILGKRVSELEGKIAEYAGVKHAISVASGTDALHLAIDALGIGPGDEVITSPFTFFATVEAILYTGATPVFTDIDPETFNIDAGQLKDLITKNTRAIIPVHLFGHPADMDAIASIARKHKLKIIEDCAQSFGAEFNGIKTGNLGDAGCFSFYPSKNLGAYGDGGIITINKTPAAEVIKQLRNHGSKGSYRHKRVGFNSRLDELQAGILLIKLRHIDEYNRMRRRNADLYTELLSDTVKCPVEKKGSVHVYHQYTVRSKKRDIIQQKLRENGISSVVYYPAPLHLQEALKFLGYQRGDFPEAEKAARQVLSLPMYPELDAKIIRKIARIIKSI